jgi:hypothetical protein
VNQVESAGLECPEIQWSGASRIDVTSGHVLVLAAGIAGASESTLDAPASDAAIAMAGASPAVTTATTAVTRVRLFTVASFGGTGR